MMLGGRADQRHKAAKDGGKGQRHQGEGRGALGLVGGFQVNRHQQGQRRHIVHDAQRGRSGDNRR